MTLARTKARAGALAAELTGTTGSSMSPLWFTMLVAPEVGERLDRLGLAGMERYFAMRTAPLGAASLELATATFFNFSPRVVGQAIPQVWNKAAPAEVLTAQREGLDECLGTAFAALGSDIIEEAATLMRTAAEAAAEHPEGRPLFAGYASLPWPATPHLDLWHAHCLLREFRGDGHIAVLTSEGLTGIESAVIHTGMAPQARPILQGSRGWTDDEWMACVGNLRGEGWLEPDGDDFVLTSQGAQWRQAIEARTDELDLPAWAAIGEDGCRRVVELAEPITQAILGAGLDLSATARPSAS